MKTDTNPIDPTRRLRDALRCHATAKSTHERCKPPAVRGWPVCRFHVARGGDGDGTVKPAHRRGGRSQKSWTGKLDIQFIALRGSRISYLHET